MHQHISDVFNSELRPVSENNIGSASHDLKQLFFNLGSTLGGPRINFRGSVDLDRKKVKTVYFH
jgi:hypothetical protein